MSREPQNRRFWKEAKRQKNNAKNVLTRRRKYDIRINAGDNNEEEIPVPMPNTEVKLLSAEDTYELPCWENRKLPVFYI